MLTFYTFLFIFIEFFLKKLEDWFEGDKIQTLAKKILDRSPHYGSIEHMSTTFAPMMIDEWSRGYEKKYFKRITFLRASPAQMSAHKLRWKMSGELMSGLNVFSQNQILSRSVGEVSGSNFQVLFSLYSFYM